MTQIQSGEAAKPDELFVCVVSDKLELIPCEYYVDIGLIECLLFDDSLYECVDFNYSYIDGRRFAFAFDDLGEINQLPVYLITPTEKEIYGKCVITGVELDADDIPTGIGLIKDEIVDFLGSCFIRCINPVFEGERIGNE